MRYVSGFDEHGAPIAVADPLADRFAAIAVEAKGDTRRLAKGLLGINAIFGDDLRAAPVFVEATTHHLESLVRRGVAATLDDHLAR
jgi:fructuronate reductase